MAWTPPDPASYPLISVCVINYNGEAFLRESVGSVLSQTYPRLEIVFCDDASTDASVAIFEELIAETERPVSVVRLYARENRGPAMNVLRGLRSFTGDFVCNLDADDALLPDHVETLYGLLSETSSDIACTNSTQVRSEGSIPLPDPHPRASDEVNPVVLSSDQVLPTFYLAGEAIPFAYWHRLHRRPAARRVSHLPEDFFQNSDSAFSISQFCEARSVAFLDTPTYLYRVRSQSVSHRSTYRYVRDEVYGSLDVITQHYETDHPDLGVLNESRNCRAVAWMLAACVKEGLGLREYVSCYRAHVTPANRTTVASFVIPNDRLRLNLTAYPSLLLPGSYLLLRLRQIRGYVTRKVVGYGNS